MGFINYQNQYKNYGDVTKMKWIKKLLGKWEEPPAFELGEKCFWDDIEVGEVFVNLGCIEILYKDSEDSVILLANDSPFWDIQLGKEDPYMYFKGDNIKAELDVHTLNCYKLPKRIQAY